VIGNHIERKANLCAVLKITYNQWKNKETIGGGGGSIRPAASPFGSLPLRGNDLRHHPVPCRTRSAGSLTPTFSSKRKKASAGLTFFRLVEAATITLPYKTGT